MPNSNAAPSQRHSTPAQLRSALSPSSETDPRLRSISNSSAEHHVCQAVNRLSDVHLPTGVSSIALQRQAGTWKRITCHVWWNKVRQTSTPAGWIEGRLISIAYSMLCSAPRDNFGRVLVPCLAAHLRHSAIGIL